MSDGFSPDFGVLEQAAPTWNAKRPVRIALLGDFGAGAGAGRLETGAALAKRKPLQVEFDTLEDAMQRLRPSLMLPLGADGVPVSIELPDLEAFHPETIYASVPLFAELASLRRRLSQPAQFAAAAADVVAPLARVEHNQVTLAIKARITTEKKYIAALQRAKALGINPSRFQSKPAAMGGPYEAADSAEAAADMAADAQFRALFQTWKKLDTLEDGLISIPSVQPVANLKFTSNFGIRSDPFRGTAAFHPGVDIPCGTGTAVYATADGTVDRAERAGGYGNLVELDHGRGIQTRYGHLSKILVTAGQKVKRGQLIAMSGSTGRSTGPHLHYEVRIDGRAVNPMPFLQTADYLQAIKSPQLNAVPVSTAPAADSAD